MTTDTQSSNPLAGTAPNKRLPMAVIGCGPIGALHARAIALSPWARLVAVCDIDKTRCDGLAEFCGARPYADLPALLSESRPEAVTIATPDHLHVEPALAAMSAGCHVFCEKPLAADIDEARRLTRAAAEHRVHLAVDFNRRFAFGYQTAQRMLSEGTIGKLDYLLLRVSDRTPPPTVARHPLVIFTTLLTHHFDLARWYGGEVASLRAETGGKSANTLARSVNVSLRFANGAIGTIVAGYRDGQARTSEWLELGGTSGSLTVEEITRRVTLCGPDVDRRQTFDANHFALEGSPTGDAFYDTLVAHLQAFIEHLAHDRQPPVTAHDGLASLQLAAAAIQSIETQRPVEIPSV